METKWPNNIRVMGHQVPVWSSKEAMETYVETRTALSNKLCFRYIVHIQPPPPKSDYVSLFSDLCGIRTRSYNRWLAACKDIEEINAENIKNGKVWVLENLKELSGNPEELICVNTEYNLLHTACIITGYTYGYYWDE